jgi:hypothetical protein
MQSSKQQTAVDWLVKEIDSQYPHINILWKQRMIEQAKQMDKEQHKETFKQSRQAKIFEEGMPPVWENFEQYYNETYGTE